MLFCTISTASHLTKAASLARSLAETQAKHRFLLCLVERDRSALNSSGHAFPEVILASELGIVNFSSFMFRYTALEACKALKAKVLLAAIEAFKEEQHFVYLDSDMQAYSRFEELETIMQSCNVVLTPHHVRCEELTTKDAEIVVRTLICGTFNSGFVAVRRSAMAKDFLEWWNNKLSNLCYKDVAAGLYYDQRWLEIAQCLFTITPLGEPGYNVALWNVAKRCLVEFQITGKYLVQEKPLRCFHFSMIDSNKDMYYFTKYLQLNNPVFDLRSSYLGTLCISGATGLSDRTWDYDHFYSGEHIGPTTRLRYVSHSDLAETMPDPFSESTSRITSAQARLQKRLIGVNA